MRSKRPLGASRRRGLANGAGAGHAEPGFVVRVAFGVAAALAVVLNEAVLALWPLWPSVRFSAPAPSAAGNCSEPLLLTPAPTPPESLPRPTAPPEANDWEDFGNPLRHVPSTALRLLPGAGTEGDEAAQARRWLTFGMSSVKRPRVDYLGITLSRLFNVLGNGEETAIVVHLADFNEGWVTRTSKWLGAGFADEVEAGRLHAIHAPQALYPLQQAKLAVVMLSGFQNAELNKPFAKREGERIHGRETYWSTTGKFFIYWCQSEGAAVSHRRWSVSGTENIDRVRFGSCPAVARAPEDHEVLDPLVTGWEEWNGQEWLVRPDAGVDRLEVEAGEMLKFGDSPQRQWWRSKQNLDYAFLMWYCANISEYYMQLEDDVQVVPDFLSTVNTYIERLLLGEQWVMVSFSKLGFIGKFFNATHLPSLAEFLLTFNAEMPCDWLVWTWIDLLSNLPCTMDIRVDVEKEYGVRQKALGNATALKRLPFMRDDIQLFYKASVYGRDTGPKAGMSFGGERVFGSEDGPLDPSKPALDPNGERPEDMPLAKVRSSMAAWEIYDAVRAYPPGDTMGFWTSDTCYDRQGSKIDPKCEAQNKALEIEFAQPVRLRSVRVEMGGPDHPQDYIRNGQLLASRSCEPGAAVQLGIVNAPNVTYPVQPTFEVGCLHLVLGRPQQEWVMVRGVHLEPAERRQARPQRRWGRSAKLEDQRDEDKHSRSQASSATLNGELSNDATSSANAAQGARASAPASSASTRGSEALFSALLAALIGILAGAVGWLGVCLGSQRCHAGVATVGSFTCWVLTFMLSLDAMFLLVLTPPVPPDRAATEKVPTPCSKGIDGANSAWLSSVVTVTDPAVQVPGEGGDWRALLPGIHRVPLLVLQAKGHPLPLPRQLADGYGAPGPRDPAKGDAERTWLALGLVANLEHDPKAAAEVAKNLASAGGGAIVVVVLMPHRGWIGPETRQHFVDTFLQSIHGVTTVHVLDPPRRLFPQDVRPDNVELALLARYAEPLAGMFMHVEADCKLLPNFKFDVQAYLDKLIDIPWIMVSFTMNGFKRKLMKARLLPRWAEFLVMFPKVPADTLYWGFIDVVGNETAPKAIFIASDAAQRKRPDVILQYHRNEAIIEHLGDVSSLEGKVQRVHEDFFKKHALVDTLFDNPAAKVRTNFKGKDSILQSVYDGSTPSQQVTCGGHSAPSCAACPQGHGASWCNVDCMWVNGACVSIFKTSTVLDVGKPANLQQAFVELVFDKPLDVEVFNFRMGGGVSATKAGSSARKANMPDPDFDHTLDDAELQFGHGELLPRGANDPACRTYNHIDAATGREVFWRSPQSRPAVDVRCIRVAVSRAQQRPLIIRGMHVRSAHQHESSLRKRLPAPEAGLGLHGGPPVHLGLSSGAAWKQELETWSELHVAWVLLVSVAFVSGAFSGVLGCVGRAFAPKRHSRQA